MWILMGCVVLGFIGGIVCTVGVYEIIWAKLGRPALNEPLV